jgi:hypothetical protein
LAVTGTDFFFGCSAATAAAGNKAIRRISFPIRPFIAISPAAKGPNPFALQMPLTSK